MKTDANHDQLSEPATRIRGQFEDIISQLRQGIGEVKDPREKALFEVSAEVIIGLQKAFTDFEAGNEEAWQK